MDQSMAVSPCLVISDNVVTLAGVHLDDSPFSVAIRYSQLRYDCSDDSSDSS